MSVRVRWNYENHLGEDAAKLEALRLEGESLDLRLEAIAQEREDIVARASARARKAGDRPTPFRL